MAFAVPFPQLSQLRDDTMTRRRRCFCASDLCLPARSNADPSFRTCPFTTLYCWKPLKAFSSFAEGNGEASTSAHYAHVLCRRRTHVWTHFNTATPTTPPPQVWGNHQQTLIGREQGQHQQPPLASALLRCRAMISTLPGTGDAVACSLGGERAHGTVGRPPQHYTAVRILPSPTCMRVREPPTGHSRHRQATSETQRDALKA